MGHAESKHHFVDTTRKKVFASTHALPIQRSVTPPLSLHEVAPPTSVPGSADTLSTVTTHRRRQRVEEITQRNPNLDFKLPTQRTRTTTIGYLTVHGTKVECSNQEAHDIVWNAHKNCVDSDIGDAIQMLCERTLRNNHGGFLVVLHHGASTFHFVSYPPSLDGQGVRISVRAVDTDGSNV